MRVALLLVVAMLLLAVVEPKVTKKTKKTTPVKKKTSAKKTTAKKPTPVKPVKVKKPVKKAGAKKVTPSAVHTKSKSATKDKHKAPTKDACGSTCKLHAVGGGRVAMCRRRESGVGLGLVWEWIHGHGTPPGHLPPIGTRALTRKQPPPPATLHLPAIYMFARVTETHTTHKSRPPSREAVLPDSNYVPNLFE